MTASIFISHSVCNLDPSKGIIPPKLCSIFLWRLSGRCCPILLYFKGPPPDWDLIFRQFEAVGVLWHGFWKLQRALSFMSIDLCAHKSMDRVASNTVVDYSGQTMFSRFVLGKFPPRPDDIFFQSSFTFQCWRAKVNLYLRVSRAQRMEATHSTVTRRCWTVLNCFCA